MLNWVEIDAEALRWNIDQFRRRLEGGSRFGAVVKSNAYGHGIHEVARLAEEAGVEWLCVNNVDEAVELRTAGRGTKILILGYTPLDRLGDIVEHELRPVVYNLETLDRLDRLTADLGRRVLVHLKVETGTQRQGIAEGDLESFLERIRRAPGLELEGLTTHFANIEDTTDHSFAEDQISRFAELHRRIRSVHGEVPMRHAACSAAALLFSRTHLDLARVGISLYGLWPSRETYVACLERGKPTLELRPVLSWKTRVAQVKEVPEGSYVGYGCTYRLTRPSKIAVLPVGYYEGYDRKLSGVAHVLIRGRRAPVRGRVCMNISMVDVTDIPDVELEDEVVLLGSQGEERISAEQLAAWCGTISYEVVSRINPAVPRRIGR